MEVNVCSWTMSDDYWKVYTPSINENNCLMISIEEFGLLITILIQYFDVMIREQNSVTLLLIDNKGCRFRQR
jgi:hypothetical protein